MSVLSELQAKNPHISIEPVSDSSFNKFGKVLSGIKADKAIAAARAMWKVADGVDYSVSVPEFEVDTQLLDTLTKRIYGGMPIEIGWVFGRNNMLNGLEFHQGSETMIVLEDVVELLALATDISWEPDAYIDSRNVRAFYVPKGSILEVPSWSMHFVPINVSKKAGFCNLFALPRGTGTALDFTPPPSPEGKILGAKNMWLLSHADIVEDGKYAGLRGTNIHINQLD